MQDKNVRGSIWLAVASFILGLAGFLVSGLFLYPLMRQFDLFGSLVHKLYTENWTEASTICGLLGWGAGFLFLKRGGKKGWLVTSGMVLSILAILGGYPFMMLMAWLSMVK